MVRGVGGAPPYPPHEKISFRGFFACIYLVYLFLISAELQQMLY